MKKNVAILTGFSKEDIKTMIDHLYGSCIWEKLGDGSIVCYPTSAGKVHLTSAIHSDTKPWCDNQDVLDNQKECRYLGVEDSCLRR